MTPAASHPSHLLFLVLLLPSATAFLSLPTKKTRPFVHNTPSSHHLTISNWVTGEGGDGTPPPLSIKPSAIGGGNGLFLSSSTKKIPAGGIVAIVPSASIISLDNAVNCPECGAEFGALAGVGGTGGKKAAVAGFVAKQWLWREHRRNLGDDDDNGGGGAWDEYLDGLPGWEEGKRASHVLWWNEGEIDTLLGGSKGYGEAVLLLDGTDAAIEILCQMLDPSAPPTREALPPGTTLDDLALALRAAFAVVYTRSFRDEANDCIKLVPVLDMSQHLDINEANIEHHADERTGDCVVTAARDLLPGEELFACYAIEEEEMELYEFATIYGFVPGEFERSIKEMLEDRDEVFFG